MKRFLLLLALLFGLDARASNVIFYYTNWSGTTATNTAVQIFPGSLPMQDDNFIVTGQPKRYALTNGVLIISNMFKGTYKAQAVGDPNPLIIEVPDDANTYYAATLTLRGLISFVTGGGLTNGIGPGTNVTFTTNGPTIVINAPFATNIFNILATNLVTQNQYWKTNVKEANAISNTLGRLDLHGNVYVDGGFFYITPTSSLDVSNQATFHSQAIFGGNIIAGGNIQQSSPGTISSSSLNQGTNTLLGTDLAGTIQSVAPGSNTFFDGHTLSALTDTNMVRVLSSNVVTSTATNFIKSLATNVVVQNQYWTTNAITTNGPVGMTNVIRDIAGDGSLWVTNAATGGVTNKAGPVQVVQGNLQVKNSLIVTSLTASAVVKVDANKALTSTAFPSDATKYLDGTGAFTVPAGITNLNSFTFQTNITSKVFNILSFGATGSGKVVTRCSMSSGSKVLTTANGTFTQADVGKVISIYGGGSANQNLTTIITNVGSTTTITVSNPAAANVVNMSSVYGPDETANIQAALNFVTTNGGTIRFPEGIYIVAGPILDTGTNLSHHNAQLFLPPAPQVPGQVVPTLTLVGPTHIQARGRGTSLVGDINASGAVIWCVYPRGSDVNQARMLDCRNFVDPANVSPACNGQHYDVWMNNINVSIHDLAFYSAFDNNLMLLDLSGTMNDSVERCFFAAGYNDSDLPQPTGTNGFALTHSGSFTENVNFFDRNTIIGFYNGVGVSGSLGGTINWISTCYNAVQAWDGSAGVANHFDFLEVYSCKNVFGTRGCETMLDGSVAVHNNVDGWWNPIVCVNDPGNTSFSGHMKFIVNSTVTNGMQIIGGLLLDAESVGNYHNAIYMPSVRHGGYAIQSAGESFLGQKYTLGLGADNGSRSLTASTVKYFGINAPRYQDTNFNLCTVLSYQGFNADNTFLAIGSDQGTFGNKGVNTIRIYTAPDGATVPAMQWQFTAGALIPVNGSANSVGVDGISVANGYFTNLFDQSLQSNQLVTVDANHKLISIAGSGDFWGTNAALGGVTNKVGAVHITQGNLEVKNSLILTSATASAVATFDANKALTSTAFPADATKYLDGTGAFTVPAGSGGAGTGIATNNGTGTNNVFTGPTITNGFIAGATDNGTYRVLPSQGNITIGEGHTLNAGASGHGASILGGRTNTMTATAIDSVIIGGKNNQIGAATNSLAAGFHANVPAGFDGSFIWADSSSTSDFYPSNNNTFNVRAQGGTKIIGGDVVIGGIANFYVTNVSFFGTNQASISSDGHFRSNPGQSTINDNFVAGDLSNLILNGADHCAIGGGGGNTINISSDSCVIAGGVNNKIGGSVPTSASSSVISGGEENHIWAQNLGALNPANVISGGRGNVTDTNTINSVIIGGISNHIGDGSSPITNSVVLGGSNNFVLASFSAALGSRITLTNKGTVGIVDSQSVDLYSGTNDEFTARFQNGYRLLGGPIINTNIPRFKEQFSCRDLIGTEAWTFGAYGAQPFNRDMVYHAASASATLSFQIPAYATNATVTYWAAADSSRAWTNQLQPEIYDTGTRAFGSASTFPVVVTSTTPVYQSNSIPIVAGNTNSLLVLTYYQVATNTANNYFFLGPITVLWQ